MDVKNQRNKENKKTENTILNTTFILLIEKPLDSALFETIIYAINSFH